MGYDEISVKGWHPDCTVAHQATSVSTQAQLLHVDLSVSLLPRDSMAAAFMQLLGGMKVAASKLKQVNIGSSTVDL